MKYYLIAGEASGDLHASRLMKALRTEDPDAEFRCIGGDLMQTEGGSLVRHYRELAYMGFVPVLLHLPTIMSNMSRCKQDVEAWRPDVVILVDYPGFNLSIAKHVHRHNICPVYYYISPKIWAWKEYRIKSIKRDVDELFSIFPFEVNFFEGKHHYPIHYVGNPTADEVAEYKVTNTETAHSSRPVIALLAGSRRQEIKDNLPAMIEATKHLAADYDLILAGAPSIDDEYYNKFIEKTDVQLIKNRTYDLLSKAHAALVTSGTATLETALFGVPQVVCYETPLPRLIGYLRKKILKVKYISLVNLIADREVVRELVADTFTIANIRSELEKILSGTARDQMLEGYEEVKHQLGDEKAPQNAARIMRQLLTSASAKSQLN